MPQSLAKILVHTVFSTKDRRPFLRDKPLRDELHKYLGGILTNLECQPVIVGGVEDLCKMTRAQIRKGSYSDEGYRFVPEIGVSIQGVDAGHAWEYALRLAIHLKIPVKAEIEWRHNEKAAHPGERGLMFWTP